MDLILQFLAKEEAEKLIYNPFYRLEHDFKDTQRAKAMAPKLQDMLAVNQRIWKEDFGASQTARKRLRAEKAIIARETSKNADLRKRLAVHDLPLVPENPIDVQKATQQSFSKSSQK